MVFHLLEKRFVKLAFSMAFHLTFEGKKNLILRYWELFNKRLLHLGIEKGAPFIWKCIHVSFKYTSVDVRPTLTDSFRQEGEKNSPDRQRKEKEKKNWTPLNYSIQQLQKTLLWTCEVLTCPDKLRYTFKQVRFWSNGLICWVQTKANLCHEVVWFIIFSFV